MQIELQKYSKFREDEIFRVKLGHSDSRMKLTLYITVAMLASIVLYSVNICYTSINVNEYNIRMFEEDLESETMDAFVDFILLARRTYKSKEETAARYRIFKDNYQIIQKHNLNSKDLPFSMAINQFADLTVDEFLALQQLEVPKHLLTLDMKEVNGVHNKVERFDKINTDMPSYKNWFEEGVVSSPSEHSNYGGSWAAVAASTLESLAFISGTEKTFRPLSTQQLIDCDYSNKGNEGGWMFKAFAYTSKYGIMSAQDYPQTSLQGDCAYSPEKAIFKNTGMIQEKSITNEKLKEIVSNQPVAAGIVANENLRFYKEGVITEDFLKCSSMDGKINQGVTVVGYGKTVSPNIESAWCQNYWIVKNTWGTTWGNKGFFKLCMDNSGSENAPFGTCQINKFVAYPTMNPSMSEAEDLSL